MTTIATLSPLSSPEQRKLAQCEETIERGVKLFVDVGLALMVIHDNKLYRAEFESFDAYCKKRWGYAKSYSYRLIESAKVYQSCSQIGDTDPPENEAQARELAKIETPEKQADVWVKAVETAPVGSDGKPRVTAAHVRKVANEMAGKSKPELEDEEADINANPDWCRVCKRSAGDGTCDRCITIASEIEEADDPTDISEPPAPSRSDVHGLTPQAVDEAMARLQRQERDKASATEQPKPAEPNELGQLRGHVFGLLDDLISGKPPHFRTFLNDLLKEWMSQ